MFPFFCISFEAIAKCMADFFPAANKVYRNTKSYRVSFSRLMSMIKKEPPPPPQPCREQTRHQNFAAVSLSLARTEKTSRKDPDPPVHTGMLLLRYRSIFLPAQTLLHQIMSELVIQCPMALIILSCQKMVLYIS